MSTPEERYRFSLLTKDTILNKTTLDLFVFSGIGWTAGVALSIFFKNKLFVRHFTAGMGSSYAFGLNKENFNKII